MWILILTQLALADVPSPDALMDHAAQLGLTPVQLDRLDATAAEAREVEQDLRHEPDLLREAAHLLFEEAMSVLTDDQQAMVRELLPPPPPHRILIERSEELGLSTSQRQQLWDLLEAREPALRQLHAQDREAAHEAGHALMVEMFEVLTPEQRRQAKTVLPPPPKNKRK